MEAYMLSNENEDLSLDEKIKVLSGYNVNTLLYVLREAETKPKDFEVQITKRAHSLLCDKGIMSSK